MDNNDEMNKKKRNAAAFGWHVLIFFIIVMLLWVLWYIGLKAGYLSPAQQKKFPWPVWPMLIWAMALMFHYSAVFNKKK